MHVRKRPPQSPGGKTVWQVRGIDPATGRQRVFGNHALKRDAERQMAALTTDLARGQFVDPDAAKIKVGEIAKRWREGLVNRESTLALVDSHLRVHVLPRWKDVAVGAVRPSDVQAWIRHLGAEKPAGAGLAASTVRQVFLTFSSCMAAALADELIRSNPCASRAVSLPKIVHKRVVPLTTDQVAAIADAVPDRYRALIYTAAGTGLRQGEVFGLRRSRVNFLRRELTVDCQLQSVHGEPPRFVPPKTAKSTRTIPLPQSIVDLLAAHLAHYGEEPAAPGYEDLIFRTIKGYGIPRTRFSERVWLPAIAEADGVVGGTHFHELRHYYASLLIEAGENVRVVQERLGHSSATETLNTYSHLWADTEGRTRDAVDAALGSKINDSGYFRGTGEQAGGL